MELILNEASMHLAVLLSMLYTYVVFQRRLKKNYSAANVLTILSTIVVFGVFAAFLYSSWSVIFCVFLYSFTVMVMIFEIRWQEAVLAVWCMLVYYGIFYYTTIFLNIGVGFLNGSIIGGNPGHLLRESVILLFIICYGILARNKISVDAFFLKGFSWILVNGVLFVFLIMFYYAEGILAAMMESDIYHISAISMGLSGLASILFGYALTYYITTSQIKELEREYIEKSREWQKQYFRRLLEKEEHTRRFRHDIAADLMQLESFHKNGDYERLGKYLNDMSGEIISIQDWDYDVGNEIINTVINYYLQPIKDECDIKVKGVVSENVKIEDRALVGVVSNLLKNAIEAQKKIAEEGHSIWVEVRDDENYFGIIVKNSVAKEVTFNKYGLPQSDEIFNGDHGLGTGNVLGIVKEFNGECRWYMEEGYFVAEVYMGKSFR